MKRNCFYVPGSTSLIDIERDGVTAIHKKTLEQLRKEHPTVVMIDLDEAVKQIDDEIVKKYVTEPVEITEDDFEEALSELPPLDYCSRNGATTFKCEEMTISHYTSIYCWTEGRYFSFIDSQFMSHEEIVEKVKKSKAFS
ncbi:MAG: hypothetical protein VKL42_08855 [Snowella sp.]|nr:hypothetical protein [Snowella sp.]